jgi:hypothetical protein
MPRDPIPHIGAALHLKPAWLFGYLWRYAGNGAGLSVAFFGLGFRRLRAGLLFGLFVCGGLLVVLVISPAGQRVLFPLNATTVTMATIGHLVYGAGLVAFKRLVDGRPSGVGPRPAPARPRGRNARRMDGRLVLIGRCPRVR